MALDPKKALDDILSRSLHGGDKRALAILKALYWLNENGEINLNIPALKKSMQRVSAAQAMGIQKDDVREPLLVS